MVRPAGIVTFLFTDIEGSTRRWEVDAEGMRSALVAHDQVLRTAIESEGGWLFKHTGDGVCAAFTGPGAAVAAAISAQRSLELPVRMGIASGEAEQRGDDYFGPVLNRTARVMAAGHGGQILVAGSTLTVSEGLDVIDLGPRRLRDLAGPVAIFQVRADGLRAEFPPLRTLDAALGNLPTRATSFVGREDQVVAVGAALRDHRLVTLVGVGGVGKTSLALCVAAGLVSEYRDGAWLVELAPVLDPADLIESVAGAFVVSPQAGRTWLDGLVESLRGRRLLVVLDNCEHIIGAAAGLAEAILARCPDLTLLATSREVLDIAGERVWPVPPLEVGPDSTASVLFSERAAAAVPGLDVEGDAEAIAEICTRLDGIPLAIELAAARVRSMSPAQIRDRLDERFRLLTGSRLAHERHQTLLHTVQWSYDLLTDDEKLLLQHAAVFSGGFSLSGATAVCDVGLDEFETVDLLDSLVRKSLVDVERTPAEPRYRLLETIRQFAAERLVENRDSDAIRDRHAWFFADQSQAIFDVWRSPHEALAYRFIDHEMANLRAAFRWATDRGLSDAAIRIPAYAHAPARMRLRTETFGWAGEVVDLARRIEHRQLPLLLSCASDSKWGIGLLDEAKDYALESVALCDDPRFDPFLWAHIDLAEIATFEGDVAAGVEVLRRGAEHPADERDRVVLSALLFFAGQAGQQLPDDQLAEAIAKIRAAGFPFAVACGLSGQATSLAESDTSAAIEIYQEAVDLLASSGNRLFEQRVRAQLAGLIAAKETPDRALASFVEIVDAWSINGDTMLAAGIGQLAVLLAQLGYQDGAVRLYGTVTRGISLDELVPELNTAMTSAREGLGEPTFRAAYQAGAALTHEAAGDLARELIADARSQLAQDK